MFIVCIVVGLGWLKRLGRERNADQPQTIYKFFENLLLSFAVESDCPSMDSLITLKNLGHALNHVFLSYKRVESMTVVF